MNTETRTAAPACRRRSAHAVTGAAAALALSCLVLAPALSAAPMDELFALLAQRQHGRVRFTQEQFLALLKSPLRSSGELRYDAPDRLEQRIEHPRPQVLILEHGTLRVQRGRRTLVMPLEQQPAVLPLVDAVRALLAGDRTALERLFALDFSGSLAEWTLTLTPRDAAAGRALRRILVTGSAASVREIEMTAADGDRSVLRLGPELPP